MRNTLRKEPDMKNFSTINNVTASGKCIAATPYYNGKTKVTLLCYSQRGITVFPQFICNNFDKNLLLKNVFIEGFVQNRPEIREKKKVYRTAFTATTVQECPNMSKDFDEFRKNACDNRVKIYLQGEVTSVRDTSEWTTMTVDVGKARHMPVRVQHRKSDMSKKPVAGDRIKCACELLTPRKKRDGKQVTYKNIIATDFGFVE